MQNTIGRPKGKGFVGLLCQQYDTAEKKIGRKHRTFSRFAIELRIREQKIKVTVTN